MRTLYLDCAMGAAGDMLAAALIELLPDPDGFVKKLNDLGIPGVEYKLEPAVKRGVTGSHMSVLVDGKEEDEAMHQHPHDHDREHNHHSAMYDIEYLVGHYLPLPESVREHVLAVYDLIAEAESHVHGVPIDEVHFHEVGSLDAVADVTAVCLAMAELSPVEVVASPIHVGSGQVRCAHGLLPVPAPATAYLLRDAPIYGGTIQGELCTPTGAALLKHFARRFGPMPPMRPKAIGYGMGRREYPDAANCVRAILGESVAGGVDTMLELSCNVDDMTAEAVGFAMERLFEAGAREVYTVPIGMKKSRPGTLLRVICSQTDREEMVRLLFAHTTTLGVRETETRRYVLDRREEKVDTPCGPVRRKISRGYGVTRTKYEYEDLARIAREKGVGLAEAEKLAEGR